VQFSKPAYCETGRPGLGRTFGLVASRETYPEEARRRGEEDHMAVRIAVDRGSRVQDAAIVGTSGSERLDATALKLLRHASLPAFADVDGSGTHRYTTTMRYSPR
jgi:TonB family protein